MLGFWTGSRVNAPRDYNCTANVRAYNKYHHIYLIKQNVRFGYSVIVCSYVHSTTQRPER